MEINEITSIQNDVYSNLSKFLLTNAFKRIQKLIDSLSNWELTEELNRISTSYSYMLKYVANGISDAQRDNILSQIIADSYSLTDKTVISLLTQKSNHIFYIRHKASSNVNIQLLVDDYLVQINKLKLIKSVEEENQNHDALVSITQQCERIENDIFNYAWSIYPTTSENYEYFMVMMKNDAIPNHLKSLIISALLLGSTKFFDETKLKILLSCYIELKDTDLKLRALINSVIIIYLYRDRISIYKDITKYIATCEEIPEFNSDLKLIFTRLIHSRNTDNITKKMKEGIMPEIHKLNPDLFNKLKGKNPGTFDINDLEENPQWQEWLDKSGITRKLEEFNEIQLQGGDVFISTFSKLKSYPFFNTLSNWFLPYHNDCSAILSAFGKKENQLTSLISNMPFMCDSDKYSMILSIATTPETHRQMLFSQFDAQKEQFKELQSIESQSVIKMKDSIVNRYIQDLYRFYKLYSRRKEFTSIFDTNINLLEVECLKNHICDTETLSIISEFYFTNGFYLDAIQYFQHMIDNHDANPHVYQKMGFSYQSMNRFREALKNYSKYEIVDNENLWNIKQMAQCYRNLHNYDKAIEYYNRALTLSPESVQICLNIGHCYLDKGDYDNALNQYYKADFMTNAKHRAWRPIAWCSLLTGKNEQGTKYYEKIINDDVPTSQDYLNYGHLLQAMGNISLAITHYKKSLALEKNNINSFIKLYTDDAKYMIDILGISKSDYALILDAVIFDASKNET